MASSQRRPLPPDSLPTTDDLVEIRDQLALPILSTDR
jgi:hypothetical protein